MSFWDKETCEYCGGAIVEKRVTVHRKVKGRYALIENVPAGVCTECGTRYYAANVLKTMEESLHGRRQAEREELVPVYSLQKYTSAFNRRFDFSNGLQKPNGNL